MDLVDRLTARAQRASILKAGSFSDLAADARSDQWIDQCVNDSSKQEAGFATEFLLRALQTADFIVAEIESQGPLLEFFAGTSRDILLYESLHFSVHALSDALRHTLPMDRASTVTHFLDTARLAASVLGQQHLGDFDSSLHSRDRAQLYLPHVGKLRAMSECLVDILVSVRGATVIKLSEALPSHEVGIEIEISLRSIASEAVDSSVGENAERLSIRYAAKQDHLHYHRGSVNPDGKVSAAMSYYCVQSRAEAGPMRTFWVRSDSKEVARKLVALNISDAVDARSETLFDCFLDDTKTPPAGLIYSDSGGPITIAIFD